MSDIEAWLTLLRQPGVGPRATKKLLGHFGGASAAIKAPAGEWRKAGLNEAQLRSKIEGFEADISDDLKWLEKHNHHAIALDHPDYPQLLREINDPPSIIFLIGDPDLLHHPQLAIVGSRNASRSGETTARDFAHHLAGAGLGITSGLALGIDSAAHRGALEADGITIAVAGTGLDRVYPARNRALAEAIATTGALVSEFPIGVRASPENFPRRNRIISGLSLGTLVVEAAVRSGSLITARVASEQGREVFAIPGSIHNPMARGCHLLIRQGAKLVETAGDILEELAPLLPLSQSPEPKPKTEAQNLDEDHARVLQAIDYDPTPVDMIIKRSEMAAHEVSSILLILELNGQISSETGGYYTRVTSEDS